MIEVAVYDSPVKKMTPREFLSQAWQIEGRIAMKMEEKERLESKLESGRTSNLNGMPRGGQYDWTDSVASLLRMVERIDTEIAKLCRIKQQVADAIDAVGDMRYRRVLELRYRNYLSWDAIAAETGYSLRSIYRFHNAALEFVIVPGE